MELLAERKNAKIYRDYPWCFYDVKEAELSAKERELVSLVNKTVVENYSMHEMQYLFLKDKSKEQFIEQVINLRESLAPYSNVLLSSAQQDEVVRIVSGFVASVAPNTANKSTLVNIIVNDLVGLSAVSPLLEDDELEEVMVNGAKRPVFVFDRKYGLCKSSVSFKSEAEILSLIKRVSSFVTKDINSDIPMLDARLPDGSRINATIAPASPKGNTVTIRKFRKKPLSVIELIAFNTLSAELAAFLWLCVEGMHVSPVNLIIAGGTGSGKTTTLNALSVFIPPRERIITIEDTLELNLYDRENWVQLESRPAIFQKQLELDDLLKNSIRMRPDRILVGEVRGKEAETMFVAMDVGHQGMMSTLHANSARETVLRLQSTPMNVPTSMFTLLDIIVMQHRMYRPDRGLIRRVGQVSEVKVMGDHVLLEDVFTYDRQHDEIMRTDLPSYVVEKLSFLTGAKKEEVQKEIYARMNILKDLVSRKVFDYPDIQKVVLDYYRNPESVLDKVDLGDK